MAAATESSFPAGLVIERGLPNAVRYDLSAKDQVTITLPRGSTWTSGLHWHETHTEYLRVVQGSIRVRLGKTVQIISAGDGDGAHPVEITVARNVWHEWSRADPDGEEDVVVVERTDPADGEKALFFWNLNGVILKAPSLARDPASRIRHVPMWLRGTAVDLWVSLNLFMIFQSLDNFPVFVNLPRLVSQTGLEPAEGSLLDGLTLTLEWLWSHLVLKLARIVGILIGAEAVRREFTPAEDYHRWASGRKEKVP